MLLDNAPAAVRSPVHLESVFHLQHSMGLAPKLPSLTEKTSYSSSVRFLDTVVKIPDICLQVKLSKIIKFQFTVVKRWQHLFGIINWLKKVYWSLI